MAGSGTIRVRKRDGRREAFDVDKLAGSLWAPMQSDGGDYRDARELAGAIRLYLERRKQWLVGTDMIFEMAIKILRRVRYRLASSRYEQVGQWRQLFRKRFRVVAADGQSRPWNKSTLAQEIQENWQLSWATSRLLVGTVESDLMAQPQRWITDVQLRERLNACVCAHGLADAVTVSESRSS